MEAFYVMMEAAKGNIMSSGNTATGCKTDSPLVKPVTTFSGRTDVDAAQLVKTPGFQELLRRVRAKKQRTKGKDK